jgi:transducin (beta)-like 1
LKHVGSGDAKVGTSARGDVSAVAWSPDGSLLATAGQDGVTRLWREDSGDLLRTLAAHTDGTYGLAWSPDGNHLATCGADHRVVVWETGKAESSVSIVAHAGPVMDVAWRDNDYIASCSSDRSVAVFQLLPSGGDATAEAGSLSVVHRYNGHAEEVNAVAWDDSGSLLASASDDCSAIVWAFRPDNTGGSAGSGAGSERGASASSLLHTLTGHTKEVYSMSWEPMLPAGGGGQQVASSRRLATCSFDCSVKVWDVVSGVVLHTLRSHRGMVYCVRYAPAGRFLASGSFDRCTKVWDAETGSLVRSYTGPAGVFDVAWHSDGARLAVAYADASVAVVNVVGSAGE